jgi:hypothetical protein
MTATRTGEKQSGAGAKGPAQPRAAAAAAAARAAVAATAAGAVEQRVIADPGTQQPGASGEDPSAAALLAVRSLLPAAAQQLPQSMVKLMEAVGVHAYKRGSAAAVATEQLEQPVRPAQLPVQLAKQVGFKLKRRDSPSSSSESSESDGGHSSSSSDGDSSSGSSDEEGARGKQRAGKRKRGSSSSRGSKGKLLQTYEKKIERELAGSKEGKPIKKRHAALLRFKKPLRRMLHAAEQGDSKAALKQGRVMAVELSRQSRDLLVAARYGWDAVGSSGSDSDDPIPRRERRRIEQRLQRSRRQREAEQQGGGRRDAKQAAAGGGKQRAAPCFNCGKWGHMARECTRQQHSNRGYYSKPA